MSQVLVTGKVKFEQDATSFDNATAYINLLDVSRQDAPSQTIAKQVINNIKLGEFSFSLFGMVKDPRGMYVVSVHVDVDGDGEVSTGDYITTGYYEISAQQEHTDIDVTVKKV